MPKNDKGPSFQIGFVKSCGGFVVAMTRDAPIADMRASSRIRTYLGGRVTIVSELAAISCLVRDLSEGGAQLVLTGAEGLPNEIRLDIPRMKLATRAKVMWRQGDVCGVQFMRET